jgi:hypothetical protein
MRFPRNFMRFDLARSAFVSLLISGSVFGIGCTQAPASEEEAGASTDPIVSIDVTHVKRQSIGNCWIYATASWAESLIKQANPNETTEPNLSESYWTYWHWFDQIANGQVSDEVTTGGFYTTAAEIIARYGMMSEADFIPAEADQERSLTQKSALAAINTSLKSGKLSTTAARRDRKLVRSELNAAFQLGDGVVAQMDAMFAPDVSKTLDRNPSLSTSHSTVKRAADFKAELRDPQTKTASVGTLQDAIGVLASSGSRTGRFAWQTVDYPNDATSRRTTLARVQRAMQDGQPVLVSWYVDFNAMANGQFAAPPATPGRQGGHMVIVEDYQVDNVPGFGTLKAGVNETRPDALKAALSPEAQIEFIRIKNSWGTQNPDPLNIGAGFYDLYMKYLNGPLKECTTNPDETPTSDCWSATPLESFVLPAGY